jgi:hypothetical protein
VSSFLGMTPVLCNLDMTLEKNKVVKVCKIYEMARVFLYVVQPIKNIRGGWEKNYNNFFSLKNKDKLFLKKFFFFKIRSIYRNMSFWDRRLSKPCPSTTFEVAGGINMKLGKQFFRLIFRHRRHQMLIIKFFYLFFRFFHVGGFAEQKLAKLYIFFADFGFCCTKFRYFLSWPLYRQYIYTWYGCLNVRNMKATVTGDVAVRPCSQEHLCYLSYWIRFRFKDLEMRSIIK